MTTLEKSGQSHRARKQLFQTGLNRGFLTVQEIESNLPPESMTAAERWLFYYSLRAAKISILDESGELLGVDSLTPEELERLTAEQRTRTQAGKESHEEAEPPSLEDDRSPHP